MIGEAQPKGPRAFVGCFDYAEMSNAITGVIGVLASVETGVFGIAMSPLGLFAEPFVAKDIFFPEGSTADDSRNTATHEYGHYVMCDILNDKSGALSDLYNQRAVNEWLHEEAGDETGISMESFADLFASQVNSGVNYFSLNNARHSNSNYFCSTPQSPPVGGPCLEENFRGDPGESPVMNDPYREQIRRLVTLYHDALDRPTDGWRDPSLQLPTNGDGWEYDSASGTLRPNNRSSWNLRDVDDEIQMSGPSIHNWIYRSAGGGIGTHEILSNLATELFENHYTWCQVCPLFALHDPHVAPGATRQEQWQACRDGLVGDYIASPPDPNLRLSKDGCTVCPAHQFSDSNGVCTSCPGDRDVVVGNTCQQSCVRGQIAVDDTCKNCASNQIVVGNSCVDCPGLQFADRSGANDTCVECPADAVLDVSTFVDGSLCSAFYDNIAAISAPNDICPDTFWLDIQNVQALGAGQSLESGFWAEVYGFGPAPSGDCTLETRRLGYVRGITDNAGSESVSTSELEDVGEACPLLIPADCHDTCYYGYPVLVDQSPANNSNVTRIRLGITPRPGFSRIAIFASAGDICPPLQ